MCLRRQNNQNVVLYLKLLWITIIVLQQSMGFLNIDFIKCKCSWNNKKQSSN